MTKTILVAGYSKLSYIQKIKGYFPNEEVTLICAYTRQPLTDLKKRFLEEFDLTIDLSVEAGVTQLKELSVDCITCTQERDMVTYIQALLLCGKISDEQSQQYINIINKRTFKEILKEKFPQYVPAVYTINEELLSRLDTLSYPLVIKPSGLAGSIMIHVVHSADEFKKHYDTFGVQMQEIAQMHYLKEIEVIAEEYIDGPQYSVNVYINDAGVATFCPIVRVITPQEMGINDTYSVMQYTTDELTPSQRTDLEKAVTEIANHFKLRSTSAHFDSVYQDGQWKFFEVGLRIGGNRQKLFELSHNMDHFGNDIKNRLGDVVIIPEISKSVCILQKASDTHGILQEISYTRAIHKEKSPLIVEDKMAKIGAEVKPLSLGGGTITRHYIIGTDEDAVIATSKDLFNKITFDLS